PKFNKKPIYNLPSNKYQEFTNAYVYSIMVKTGNGTPNRDNWSLGTSSITHMQDLERLTLDPQYNDTLKTDGEIRPIWVLLVDGGPDENPRHLKNIKMYC
ncbi:6766_t:CDS:2, partial [Funneliformis geosporum]